MSGTVTILYWPNGVWCLKHELEQMTHMSDDFVAMDISDTLDVEEIEELIEEKLKG